MTDSEDRTVCLDFENGIERELDQAYRDLGKAYYEGGFEDPLPQLLPLFDRITRLRNSEEAGAGGAASGEVPYTPEEEVPAEEKAAGGFCRKCGKVLEPGEIFCGNCGCKVG